MKYNTKPKNFNIKNWMKNYNMTYRKLETLTGIGCGHLCRLEQGTYVAEPQTAVKMFKAMQKHENKVKLGIYTNFDDLIKEVKS